MEVIFNQPSLDEAELTSIAEALRLATLSGDGRFSAACHDWLRDRLGVSGAFLTPSGTAALELGMLLCELQPGDEVIMPSYTFSSTANAAVLRGAVPVFVDVEADTLNLDPACLDAALTDRTRAIVPVHYAGVPAEMDAINAFAARHGLWVIEDAAQALGSSYRGRPAGTLGHGAAFSFHVTKNLVSGEGGAFVTDRPDWTRRAEILREKGTNRSAFKAGHVDKYTWVDLGSSFLPSELQAAMLAAQFGKLESITARRRAIWERYFEALDPLERAGRLRRLKVPEGCTHNGHIFAVILAEDVDRTALIAALKARGVNAVFHYVPLHSAPAGLRFGRAAGEMRQTDIAGARLLRLPMNAGLSDAQVDHAIAVLGDLLTG